MEFDVAGAAQQFEGLCEVVVHPTDEYVMLQHEHFKKRAPKPTTKAGARHRYQGVVKPGEEVPGLDVHMGDEGPVFYMVDPVYDEAVHKFVELKDASAAQQIEGFYEFVEKPTTKVGLYMLEALVPQTLVEVLGIHEGLEVHLGGLGTHIVDPVDEYATHFEEEVGLDMELMRNHTSKYSPKTYVDHVTNCTSTTKGGWT